MDALDSLSPHRGGFLSRLLTPSARGLLLLSAQVVLAIGLCAALQILAMRHNVRFDLTPEQSFLLSDQAARVAGSVERPVRITVFYSSQQGEERREMADLLEQFRAAAPALSYRLLDLDRSPGLARKFGISSYNTGVVESDGRVMVLRSVSEEEIAAALLELTRDEPRTLCFVTGHGEHSPGDNHEREGYSEVAKALERENFAIETIRTVPRQGVPPECTILVLAGPTHELLPGEADLIEAYVRGGGRAIVLADPATPASVSELLERFGIVLGNDIIVDERNRFFGADSFTAQVPMFDQGIFGDRLETAAVFPLARTVLPRDESGETGGKVSLLALSSPDSWALVGAGIDPDNDVQFREDVDRRGPVPVGALSVVGDGAADGETAERPGKLVVFGDSDFAANFYLNLLGNKDLFMSTVAILAEEEELVAVRRKGPTRGTISPISLTAREGSVIFWTAVVAQPLAFLLIGAIVVLVRRKRHGGRA